MKNYLIIFLLLCLSLSAAAQKSRVLAVKQMIDVGKYEEAKEAIDLAVRNDRTARWHRTYFTKGLLCQTAYEEGVKKKETKKTSLYPDQLFVAFDSYEKALELDTRERMFEQIRQLYFALANDFKDLGEELYLKGSYAESLRAFEQALLISKSDLVSARTDTSLIYNTAMAAYESANWEKATEYLSELHEMAYSTDASLLLAMSWQNAGDSIQCEKILRDAVELYAYDESVVIYLANDLASSGRLEATLVILNKAISARPDNFIYLWARGLVYRRMNNYDEAILNFQEAAKRAPDTPTLYYHIGISYYNVGVDLRQSALMISENDRYREVREQYMDTFREAVKWLERAYVLDPTNERLKEKLNLLYYQLDMKEEQKP